MWSVSVLEGSAVSVKYVNDTVASVMAVATQTCGCVIQVSAVLHGDNAVCIQ